MYHLPRNLTTHPAVLAISKETESTPFATAGRFLALFEWFEIWAPDRYLVAPRAAVDQVVLCSGFCKAAEAAGVLIHDGHQLEVMVWWSPDDGDVVVRDGERIVDQDLEEEREKNRERCRKYRERSASRRASVPCRDARRSASRRASDVGSDTSIENTTTCGDRHDNCTRAGAGAPGLSQPAFNTKAGAAEDSHAGAPPQQRGSPNVTQSSEPVRQSTPSPTPEPERPVTPGGRGEVAELLRQAKVEPGVAMEILISPRGTLARVTWAIERTRQRLYRIREKGGKARSGARYLKWMVLKCPEGPDAKLVGGSIGEIPAAGGQVQRVKVLAQLKTMGVQS